VVLQAQPDGHLAHPVKRMPRIFLVQQAIVLPENWTGGLDGE